MSEQNGTNTEFHLTNSEKRLIKQFRDLKRKSKGRPLMLIAREVDGIVQLFEAVPRGQMKA